ncbi:MAG: hypothetical protein AAF386_01465 [Pseudomonadota bacterium]
MAEKFGPTKGEYVFRICGGLLVFGLLIIAMVVKGVPGNLVAVETFLFGGGFAAFLVGHSGYRLATGRYRITNKGHPSGNA